MVGEYTHSIHPTHTVLPPFFDLCLGLGSAQSPSWAFGFAVVDRAMAGLVFLYMWNDCYYLLRLPGMFFSR